MTNNETLKERLYTYLEYKKVAPSNFEKTIGAGGSYLKKRQNIRKRQTVIHI